MITKAYLVDSVVIPVHANVKDNQILPYITPALDGLRASLPIELYTALDTLYSENVGAWSNPKHFLEDAKCTHPELGILKMWEAVQDNNKQTPSTSNDANWTELQLGTFLVGYVQPYLAHDVFYAYCVNSGVNITHQGLQQLSNETAQPVSGNNLQAFLNYWKNQRDVHRRRMFSYLEEKSNTLDGVEYTEVEASKKKSRFSIRGIGRITRQPDTSSWR